MCWYSSFAKKIGKERLIKSCQRALGYGVYNYKTIHNIIERELDMQDDAEENDQLKIPTYYRKYRHWKKLYCIRSGASCLFNGISCSVS
jgi:hypothetical protein